MTSNPQVLPATPALPPMTPPPAQWPAPPRTPGAQLPETSFHRLASGPGRFWRAVLGTLFIVVGLTVGLGALLVPFTVLDDRISDPTLNSVTEFALGLSSLALLVPLVLLAARWIQRRPAGTVSSTAGRLRWRRQGRYLLLALPVVAASIVAMLVVEAISGDPFVIGDQWVGWSTFLISTAMLVVLVPFQAAGEEYLMRGWLLQAVGAFTRRPWLPIVVQGVVFAAMHGWGTPWGFADLVVFGVLTGYLAVRTGGLEAGIALHVLNNLLAMVLAATVTTGLASDETAADMTWPYVLIDVFFLTVYTVLVIRSTNRWSTRAELADQFIPATSVRPTT